MKGLLLLLLTVEPVLSFSGGRVLVMDGIALTPPRPAIQAVSTLCAALSTADKANGFWCHNGDQTMAAGSSLTMSPVNAPPTATWPILPGPGVETQTRINDSRTATGWDEYFESNDVASPSGSFTTCIVYSDQVREGNTESCNSAGVSYGVSPIWMTGTRDDCTEGDEVSICTNGAGSCASGANNVKTPIRSYGLHCAVFTAGDGGVGSGSTQVCTFEPGAQTTTCTSTAHAQPHITTTASDKWRVGIGAAGTGTASMMAGWYRGSATVFKALSGPGTTSDLTRIGKAVIYTKPTGLAFARNTPKNCFDGQWRGNAIGINVPCASGALIEVEASSVNVTNTHEDLADTVALNAGGPPGVVATQDQDVGPFGMTTLTKFEIDATSAVERAYLQLMPVNLGSGSGAQNFSGFCKGSGTVDACDQTPDVGGVGGCPTCCGTITLTSTLQRISYSNTATAPGAVWQLGNLGRYYAPSGQTRSAQTIYCGDFQAEMLAAPSSYIRLPPISTTLTNARGAESCSGHPGCP